MAGWQVSFAVKRMGTNGVVRRALFISMYILEVVGFAFTSYGVLRESFSDIATTTGFGEGRYGEGSYGGGLTGTEEFLVEVGVALRLLPADRDLTVTDRKRNAAFAVTGVILLGLAIVLDLFRKVFHERSSVNERSGTSVTK